MSVSSTAGEVLALLGDAVAGVGAIVGGPAGAGMAGAARVLRGAAAALIRGESVDEILARMKDRPKVAKPWGAPDPMEDTAQETPSAKKRDQ